MEPLGRHLRRERELRQVSLEEMAQTTRIPLRMLEHLEADRFDELAATHGFKRPFLKMDTQGFDLEVLEGALPRIDRFLGLKSEVSMIQI